MTMHHPGLAELVQHDPRYAYEAYQFVFDALQHTQNALGKTPPEEASQGEDAEQCVTPRELLDGARELALREFGLMARAVFHRWGIDRTDDFGEIFFNLVQAGLMSKTNADTRADFQGVYDLDQALVEGYRIVLEEADSP
jgi:uncharacterized repeat protein (TIGR04138 family)